jgi:hypothetical protein
LAVTVSDSCIASEDEESSTCIVAWPRTQGTASDAPSTPLGGSAKVLRLRMNCRWSAGLLFLVAGCFAAAAASAADRINSRYGDISAARRDEGTFDISLNTKPVTALFASDVSLYRVTPHGDTEYIIVELWQSGLNCQHSYVMLALHAEGKAETSRVFGQCTELRGASHVRGGVQVELRPIVQPDASKTVLERYLFSNGKVTRK